MGLARALRKTIPLLVVGAAGVVAARRRAEHQRQAQLMPGPPDWPAPVARQDPPPMPAEEESHGSEADTDAPEPEFEAEPEPDPEDEATVEFEAVAAAPPPDDATASVTDIVDDLFSPPGPGEIEDAMVVEGAAHEEPPDDEALAQAVRASLAEQPGLLPGTVEVDVRGGAVYLAGEVERPDAIAELERRAGLVPGISAVRSRLHITGTPPPPPGTGDTRPDDLLPYRS